MPLIPTKDRPIVTIAARDGDELATLAEVLEQYVTNQRDFVDDLDPPIPRETASLEIAERWMAQTDAVYGLIADPAPAPAGAPPAPLTATERRRGVLVRLTVDDIDLLAEALDSHVYWQLADEVDRHDGEVRGASLRKTSVRVALRLERRMQRLRKRAEAEAPPDANAPK